MTLRIEIRTSRMKAAVVPGDGQRHEQQEDRRDQAADVRDEPTEEDDDRQRQQRAAPQQDHRKSPRPRPVEGGDDRGPAQVATDPLEGDVAGRRDRLAAPRVGRRHHPDPRLVAVHHEEEGQERRQDRDRRDGPDVPAIAGDVRSTATPGGPASRWSIGVADLGRDVAGRPGASLSVATPALMRRRRLLRCTGGRRSR